MKVTLHQQEMCLCMVASVNKASKLGLLPLKYDSPSYMNQLTQMAESIAAEWVVAKYFNLPFDPFEEKFKVKADVGNGIEVRWTKHNSGQLIVYESDRLTDVAVLVTGEAPSFEIRGWIPMAMAKRPKYKHTKQPTWWVTQINLQPIENLAKSTYADIAI